MSSITLYLLTYIFLSGNSQVNLFLEYSTKRWDFQSIDMLMEDKVVDHLDSASATTLFFPFTYSIPKY